MADNDDFEVTPWDVEGTVDYQRLIDKFGTERLTDDLKQRLFSLAGQDNLYLRRDFIFSHRDLDDVLDDYDDGGEFYVYTGRAPSGKMHIGHIVSFYLTKWFQDAFNVNVYIQIPDDEKYWAKDDLSLSDIDHYATENIKQIAAVGFDPDKTFIFRNREYIANMYDAAIKVSNEVNYSVAKSVFGFKSSTNIGMSFYPALQMLPTFFEENPCLIPAAIDQDPYWRIQRDIAHKFNHDKTAAVHNKFIPALTGPDGKMSSSKPKSAIMLDDDKQTIKDKVHSQAYSGGGDTLKEHREHGADLNVDVSYQWLHNLFLEDDDELRRIADEYSSGEMTTGEIKDILVDELWEFLQAHQERKENADELVEDMMYDGSLASEMWNTNIELEK